MQVVNDFESRLEEFVIASYQVLGREKDIDNVVQTVELLRKHTDDVEIITIAWLHGLLAWKPMLNKISDVFKNDAGVQNAITIWLDLAKNFEGNYCDSGIARSISRLKDSNRNKLSIILLAKRIIESKAIRAKEPIRKLPNALGNLGVLWAIPRSIHKTLWTSLFNETVLDLQVRHFDTRVQQPVVKKPWWRRLLWL